MQTLDLRDVQLEQFRQFEEEQRAMQRQSEDRVRAMKQAHAQGTWDPSAAQALDVGDESLDPGTRWATRGVRMQDGQMAAPLQRNLAGTNKSVMMTIDSRVRDAEKFPSANTFEVETLKPGGLHNVVSVRLKQLMLPIINPDVHGLVVQDQPYVVLRIHTLGRKPLSAMEGARAPSVEAYEDVLVSAGPPAVYEKVLRNKQPTHNPIFETEALATIPLEATGAARINVGGGDVYVNYVVWKEKNNTDAVQFFLPPIEALSGFLIELVQWASNNDPTTSYKAYPLPAETLTRQSDGTYTGFEPFNNWMMTLEIQAQG